MTCDEILAQVVAWLRRQRCVSHRAHKRWFALDDSDVEDLKTDRHGLDMRRMGEGGRAPLVCKKLEARHPGAPGRFQEDRVHEARHQPGH
jgi:hypothetical protein